MTSESENESGAIPKKTKPGSEHREMLKKEFLKEYESSPGVTVQEAARRIGPEDTTYTPSTIWSWGRDDPKFKRDIESAQARKIQWMHDSALSTNYRKVQEGDARVRETTNFLKYLDRLSEKQASDKEDLIEGDAVGEIGVNLLRVMLLKKGVDVGDDESTEEIIDTIAKKIESGSKRVEEKED